MEKIFKILDGKPSVYVPPKYFYLNWSKYQAVWLTEKPAELRFSTSLTCKDYDQNDICVCSDYNEPFYETSESPERLYNNINYLKSHLHICVRRSNSFKALKTAKHYMDCNPETFLRQLAIIALEDALPLEGYSVLVWFIVACEKGYVLSNEQIAWCYGYLYDLCQCGYYEDASVRPVNFKSFKKLRMHKIPETERHLLYSMMLRRSVDKHNKEILAQSIDLWYHRILTKSLFMDKLQRKTIIITPPTEPLELREWYLGAIDHHCCQYLISNLTDKFDLPPQDITDAIQNYSSSLTDKSTLTSVSDEKKTDHETVWTRIRKSFFSSAKYNLNKYH